MKKQIIISLLIIGLLLTSLSGCTIQEPKENPPTEEVSLDIKATYLVENLSNAHYATVFQHFTNEMKSALPIEDLQYAWESLISSYGTFEGIVKTKQTIEQDYDVVYVTCSFATLGVLDLRFVFDDQENIAGFQFVPSDTSEEYTGPDYVNTSLFSEENITIGASPWQLPATLSIPNGEGPFPAVVLVHGSGPNDRDETIGPNKPFKDIAQGLASNGIIVLRYDKRTNVYPEECGTLLNFTPEDEVIIDALAAIHYVQNHSRADNSKIYLLGHSLGAMLAPEIANQTDLLNGVIMLAAPTRNFEDLTLAQYIYLAELDGTIDENEQAQIEEVERIAQQIKELNITSDEYVFNAPRAYWEYLSTYNTVETAESLSIPLLLLQGKRDYQVTYADDFATWQETFQDDPLVTLRSYDSLNHLFISGIGVPTNTEYLTPGNVSEDVILDISNWIIDVS